MELSQQPNPASSGGISSESENNIRRRDLPNEILVQITRAVSNTTTLKALALCCKLFSKIAISFLYRNLRLPSSLEACQEFCRTRLNPENVSHIRMISLRPPCMISERYLEGPNFNHHALEDDLEFVTVGNMVPKKAQPAIDDAMKDWEGPWCQILNQLLSATKSRLEEVEIFFSTVPFEQLASRVALESRLVPNDIRSIKYLAKEFKKCYLRAFTEVLAGSEFPRLRSLSFEEVTADIQYFLPTCHGAANRKLARNVILSGNMSKVTSFTSNFASSEGEIYRYPMVDVLFMSARLIGIEELNLSTSVVGDAGRLLWGEENPEHWRYYNWDSLKVTGNNFPWTNLTSITITSVRFEIFLHDVIQRLTKLTKIFLQDIALIEKKDEETGLKVTDRWESVLDACAEHSLTEVYLAELHYEPWSNRFGSAISNCNGAFTICTR